MNKIEVSGNFL